MKVLFLTRYPFEGASSRYRVYQYLPHLRKAGVYADVDSFMSDEMYRVSFLHGKSLYKVWLTVKAVLSRLWTLRNYKDYDIIYMQRELLPGPFMFLERWLKSRGAVLVFDYDDALFIAKQSQFNRIAGFLKSANKTMKIFAIADCVVAGNNYLRDAAIEKGSDAVTLEVAEDTVRIRQRPAHTETEAVIIGWLGSKTTVKYLGLIANALVRIHRDFPKVEFHVMGGDQDFSIPGLPLKHFPWSLDGELEALNRFDIGLMPLPLVEWSKGKSGGKARTYMAAGVVPVCTGIGYNLELIQDGETGYLCTTEDDWYATLSRLIPSAVDRQAVSDKARAYVERHFSVELQALKMRDVLQSVLSKKENVDDHRV